MTNFTELFEIYNGRPLKDQIDNTLKLFKTFRKERFVDLEEDILPISCFLHELEHNKHPVRITNGDRSLSALVLNQYDDQYKSMISTSMMIKSELMAIVTVDNLTQLKELFQFWEGLFFLFKELAND